MSSLVLQSLAPSSLLGMSSAASAVHRLSSYAVAETAKRTPKAVVQIVQSEVDALRSCMDERGVRASTFICQAAPAGVHDGSVFCVVDRKAAYRYQLEHMPECPAAQRVFSEPRKTLLEWSVANKNARVTSGVRADVNLLFGDSVPEAQRKRFFKDLYKMMYGKLCNAVKADKNMPAELVALMTLVGELVRRRNAVILMNHARDMKENFMAAFTDSVLLRGVDPAAAVVAMTAKGRGQVWEVECVAKIVVLARVNTHLFVLQDDSVLTRPHEMFGGELARSGLGPEGSVAFKHAVVEALTRKDTAALRKIYDEIPATLDMANSVGGFSAREPSVRRLLGHVLSIYHTSPPRKRKRGAAGVHYAKLSDAKKAQSGISEPCLVVGEDRAGSKGLYRRWTLMREHELVQCLGKPCHMTFVGANVGYRVVVDYDEPRALAEEKVNTFAARVKDFWQDRKNVSVSVQTLRTRTRREGLKAHAEHIIFVAKDDESGKECLLLNPEEIPLALGHNSTTHGVIDKLIYKLGKSLRLAGCPKLHEGGEIDSLSTHLPAGRESDWTPSAEEYALWSPCTVVVKKKHIVHCDVAPAHCTGSAKEQCPFLFPSEHFFVSAFVRWVQMLCGGDYSSDQPKMFYSNNDPDCNSFNLTVIFKSHASKDKKFLDYSDFAKRVAVPWLKHNVQSVVSSCKHHGSNHSYFVFKVDSNPAYGQGELCGVNANTHHDKQNNANDKQKTYMAMDDVARSRIVGEDNAAKYEEMLTQERQSVLRVSLAKTKLLYDAETRIVNAYRVRLALLRRHRVHWPGRVFPTEGRRDGWSEKRVCSHEDAIIAVTSLVQWGTKALALRAAHRELKFYKDNLKGKRAALVVQRLKELRGTCDTKKDAGSANVSAPWDAVVRYASSITYKNKVY